MFFNKVSEGAVFRLKCVASSASNRCEEEAFRSSASSLCEDAGLVLSDIAPFSCIEDIETKKSRCKFSNGSCAIPPSQIQTKERPSLDEENPPVPSLPETEPLPEVEALPEVKSLPEAPSIPENTPTVPEVEDLPELPQMPEANTGLPEANTSLPEVD